jgi:hypothetical protein
VGAGRANAMKVASSTGSATHGVGDAITAINARNAAGLIGFRSMGTSFRDVRRYGPE